MAGEDKVVPPQKKRTYGLLLAGGIFTTAVIVIPLVALFVVFPWLSQLAFTSIDTIPVAEIDELRVQLLNHPQRLPDVNKVRIAPADYDAVLAPLRNATKIDAIPASEFLGEYQVRFKDGRRGTIRLRFQPGNRDPQLAPVWFEIGPHKYLAVTTFGQLWKIVEECATRR